MTDAIMIALIAAVPPTLVALAGFFQGISNGRQAGKIVAKTEEIHTATNGHLSVLTKNLADAKQEIKDLQGSMRTELAEANQQVKDLVLSLAAAVKPKE
jgi:hypothetical protein